MSDATSDLLDVFFAAIERGDIDAVAPLYSEDAQIWHNVTGRALDRAASLELLRFWTASVSDMRYEVLERRTYPGGAVQRHVVHGTVGDDRLRAEIGIVFHVADGRITHIYEYLDPANVAAVFGRPTST